MALLLGGPTESDKAVAIALTSGRYILEPKTKPLKSKGIPDCRRPIRKAKPFCVPIGREETLPVPPDLDDAALRVAICQSYLRATRAQAPGDFLVAVAYNPDLCGPRLTLQPIRRYGF